VKERLTGAIILVVLIVLLVPELLSGPKGPAVTAPAGAAPPSSEEPPLRSYTINLGDDSHSQTEPAGSAAGSAAASNGPGMPQPSGPEQPTSQTGAPQSSTSEAAGTPSQSGAGQPSGTPLETPQQPASHEQSATRVQPTPRDQSATRAAKSTAPPQKPAAAPKPSSQTSSAAARTEAPKPTRGVAAEKASRNDAEWGTYHFAGATEATWYELAKSIVFAQSEITGRSPSVSAISSESYPSAARRPLNSRLNSDLFAARFGKRAGSWQDRVPEIVRALVTR